MSASESSYTGSAPDLSRLERRIERERSARKHAEQLLTEKSVELYEALEQGKGDRRKLELALWAGNESVWDWNADEQIYELLTFPDGGMEAIRSWGNTAQVMRRIHPDDRREFATNWQLFLSDMLDHFDVLLRYRPPSSPEHVQSRADALKSRLEQGVDLDPDATRHDADEASHTIDWHWLHWRGRIIEYDREGIPSRAVGTVKDVTDYRQTEESFQLMAKAFSSSRDAMLIVDQLGNIRQANQGFCDLFQIDQSHAIGTAIASYINLDNTERRSVSDTGLVTFETTSTHSRRKLPLEVFRNHFQPDEYKDTYYSIITLRDLTERRRAADTLKHMASHDGLTNLPNRGSLHESLEHMLSDASPERPLAIMFVDLDGFKAVNDEFGHIAADLLLVNQARRMMQITPDTAVVSRWGGDEFVFCWWSETRDVSESTLPSRVLRNIREPMNLNGASIRLSASIGVVSTTDQNRSATELIRQADAAMYEAKAQGRNRIQVFSDGISHGASHRASLVSELATAIDNDHIQFYVQPKFDNDGHIIGGEMLARWISDTAGFVSPAEFIPMIEKNGLNAAFADAVMRTGARYAAEARQRDPELHIAINLSGWQLFDSELPDKLRQQCQQYGVPCEALELEITESVFLQPDSDPVSLMSNLRRSGFRIAIDDFGTGYSSLGYLRDMPLDVVKIDRSFVIDADGNQRAKRILSAIVQMSHDLGMKTVAEGVETDQQWSLLKALNVDSYQGFLLGRPMTFESYLNLLPAPADTAESSQP